MVTSGATNKQATGQRGSHSRSTFRWPAGQSVCYYARNPDHAGGRNLSQLHRGSIEVLQLQPLSFLSLVCQLHKSYHYLPPLCCLYLTLPAPACHLSEQLLLQFCPDKFNARADFHAGHQWHSTTLHQRYIFIRLRPIGLVGPSTLPCFFGSERSFQSLFSENSGLLSCFSCGRKNKQSHLNGPHGLPIPQQMVVARI